MGATCVKWQTGCLSRLAVQENKMQEKDIIQKVLEGRHEHYAHLVKKYQNMVFLVCMGFVHNKEDANDLTQEIFINAFQKLHSFDGRAKFSTWLYRIAVNAALNAQRKKSRWKFFSLMDSRLEKPAQDDNWLIPSADDDPQQAMINHQERQLIEQAIDGLPEKQRTAFVLSKYDDLPQREIATIMNTSEGSVEQLLIRAKANLQKKLAPFYRKM